MKSDLLSVTVNELAEARRQRIELRLRELQTECFSAADRIQKAESQQPSAAAAVERAEQELQTQLQVTREHLEAAGLGPRPELLAKNPEAVRREFEHRVRTAAPCELAKGVVDQAKADQRGVDAAVKAGRDQLAAAQLQLQRFVDELLKVG